MFTKMSYFFGLVFVFFLTSCSGYETNGVRENISGGTSSISKNAASFSQTLELVSTQELQNWLGISFKAASNTRLHLNLQDSGNISPEGNATYKGSFSISYTEEFHSGRVESNEQILTTGDNPEDTQYNYVYLDTEGNFTWKAFFQDEFGSILVILTQGQRPDECSENDGCNNQVFFSMANGAIYYRNWPDRGQGSLPDKKCWLVTAGPYDCRTWKSRTGIDIDRQVRPDGSAATLSGNAGARGYCYTGGKKESPCNNIAYTKLATFKDLDFKILFQIDPNLTSANSRPSENLLAIKNAGKTLRGVASVVKNKNARKLSSLRQNQSITLLSKILLITLSFIFIGLLLVVFFRRKEEVK